MTEKKKKDYIPLPEGCANGRMSKDEKLYIESHCKILSSEQIAEKLGRNPLTIKKYIKGISSPLKTAPSHEFMREVAEFDIRKSPIWKELEKQFSRDELDVFLYHWREVSLQFKNDIYHTERMQIVDICRYEILINRALEKIRIMEKDKDKIDKEIRAEERVLEEDPDDDITKNKILTLTRLRSDCFATIGHIQGEHKILNEKKQLLLKDTRATREQRVKRIESSGENIVSWVTKLIENSELRKKLGTDMEKMRLATEVEIQRLSEFHRYEDGTLDQPFLNCDTVEE